MKTSRGKQREYWSMSGLPGVRHETIEAASVRSVTDAIRALRTERAVAAAGGEGAVTVWRLDGGGYRCEFSRFLLGKSRLDAQTLKAVREWLTEWWPKMEM